MVKLRTVCGTHDRRLQIIENRTLLASYTAQDKTKKNQDLIKNEEIICVETKACEEVVYTITDAKKTLPGEKLFGGGGGA